MWTASGTADARAAARIALRAWIAISLIVLVETACLVALGWLTRVVQIGPASDLHVTMLAVALAWLLAGIALAAIVYGSIDDALLTMAAVAVALLYVNILRERYTLGDARDYVQA